MTAISALPCSGSCRRVAGLGAGRFAPLFLAISHSTKLPELYVVGAGPGDPELLTLKAYRLLQMADVILYDNLANQELLALAPTACE